MTENKLSVSEIIFRIEAISVRPNNIDMEKDLNGKIAVVTGGTRGIGKAIADRFREGGATVVVIARNIADESKNDPVFVAADLSTEAGTKKSADNVKKAYGRVDILVNNIGGNSAPTGGSLASDDSVWQEALDTNLLAAVRLDRMFLPMMVERGKGVIIHISSIQRVLPLYESTLAYAAAKAALSTYSKGLSNEFTPRGIRVLSIAPGFIETEAAARMIEELAVKSGTDTGTARQNLIETLGGIPFGRPGYPQELGELVAFVASDKAPYLVGTEITFDGGTVRTV